MTRIFSKLDVVSAFFVIPDDSDSSYDSAGIESPSIGSHNTFEPKCRVLDSVAIDNFSTVGAGCIAQPPAQWILERKTKALKQEETDQAQYYTFPSRTVIFGQASQTRLWSGNGVRQEDALHVKHLDYLKESKSALNHQYTVFIDDGLPLQRYHEFTNCESSN